MTAWGLSKGGWKAELLQTLGMSIVFGALMSLWNDDGLDGALLSGTIFGLVRLAFVAVAEVLRRRRQPA